MNEGLKLSAERDLRLFCIRVQIQDFPGMVSPEFAREIGKSRFILGYSMDDVQNAVADKFPGRSISFDILGDISLSDVIDKINEDDLAGKVRGIKPSNKIFIEAKTPEMNRQQFFTNLKLVANRFIGEEDEKTFLEIIEKAKQRIVIESGMN